MPKFRVIHYYTHSEMYEVEAEDEDAAAAMISGPNPPEADIVTGSEFANETIEQIEEE